jgi:hypothetical protein
VQGHQALAVLYQPKISFLQRRMEALQRQISVQRRVNTVWNCLLQVLAHLVLLGAVGNMPVDDVVNCGVYVASNFRPPPIVWLRVPGATTARSPTGNKKSHRCTVAKDRGGGYPAPTNAT